MWFRKIKIWAIIQLIYYNSPLKILSKFIINSVLMILFVLLLLNYIDILLAYWAKYRYLFLWWRYYRVMILLCYFIMNMLFLYFFLTAVIMISDACASWGIWWGKVSPYILKLLRFLIIRDNFIILFCCYVCSCNRNTTYLAVCFWAI